MRPAERCASGTSSSPLTGDGVLVLVVWHPADEATRLALAQLETTLTG